MLCDEDSNMDTRGWQAPTERRCPFRFRLLLIRLP